MSSILDAALEYQAAGLSIVPTLPGGQKKPATQWKPYTQEPATPRQIEAWYANSADLGVAVISGAVSGNLTMVELEGRSKTEFPTLQALADEQGLTHLWQRVTNGWLETSPSGGWHWFYRTTQPGAGNQKLAVGADKLVLAETRGEGGYTIVSPTPGSHHATGRPWQRLTGGPTTLATLTPQEADQFLNLFRTLDQTPRRTTPTPPPRLPQAPTEGRQRPGDQWATQTPWKTILEPEGWTHHHADGEGDYWTRPGKNPLEGASATSREDGGLYVFTTSTDLETEVPLSKFFVYAHYQHGGDLTAAARELARLGYGDPMPTVEIDLPYVKPRTPGRPHLEIVTGTGPDPQPQTDGTAALAPRLHAQHSGDLTEASAGRYLADMYHQHARYIMDSDRWIAWDGHTWQPTGKKHVQIKQLAVTALEALPADTKEEHSYRKRMLGSNGVNNALNLMAADPRIGIQQSELDRHHGELNTPGGIINLHTGDLTPSDPSKLHTRSALLTPENTPTPKWDAFLDETFEGHPGITRYVQQLAGYSATGYVRAQILPFLHGAGANGKSVLAEVLQRLLNDYAEPAPSNFLMMTQQQHPTEIARLQGARLVIASEVPEGAKFDEVKVKQLTGGDTLTARYMHGDFFTFQPTHKLWLLGNHQPKVAAGGYSFWRRLRQIPFTNIVPEDKRVEDLADQLIAEEGAGILHWIIQGAVNYLAGGLDEPDEVLEATKAYEESEDHLRRFVADRLHIGGGDLVRTPRRDMRNAYVEWCRLEGQQPASANAFTREIGLRFNIGTARSNGVWQYTNASLLQDSDDPETPTENPWNDLGGGSKW